MKNYFVFMAIIAATGSCKTAESTKAEIKKVKTSVLEKEKFPSSITVEGIALNPEGIEYHKGDSSFFLSSLNAAPIIKVQLDGSFKPFTSGENFPLSTAGLQVDVKHGRLLAAGFNGTELMDKDPKTKGTAFLRIYNLETGVISHDVNLSALAPDAESYFANDIAVDKDGNAYVSDWNAKVIYKVDLAGNPSIFWSNLGDVPSGPNGLEFHPDNYLLVSLVSVNEMGLYSDFALMKILLEDPNAAKEVNISQTEYRGFDGMVIKSSGNIVGVTNDGKTPGGNRLIELSSNDDWKTAENVNSKAIKASTTVALVSEKTQYVINQDFLNAVAETWTITRVKF